MQPLYDKPKALITAEKLRRQGYMYAEISTKLGYPKSTVHGWLKNLDLTVKERFKIDQRLAKSKQKRVAALTNAHRLKVAERAAIILQESRLTISETKIDSNHKQLLCAIFFWCEGGKDTRAGFQFINSDPIMMRTFLTLLRESFVVDESKFRALVHLHDYHDPAAQMEFWSEVTSIPLQQFHKPYLKPHTGKNKRQDYPGCVSVRYLDRQFGLRLQMLYTSFGDKYRGIVHRLV